MDASKNCTSTRAGFGVLQHYKQVLVTLLAAGRLKKSSGPRTATLSSARGTIGEADFTQETFCNASMAARNRATQTADMSCIPCHCSQRLSKCAAGLHRNLCTVLHIFSWLLYVRMWMSG